MKIAFFSDTFLPSVNGIAMYIAEISRSLAKNGHEVHIFAPKSDSKEPVSFKEKNIKVHFISSIPSYVYHDLRIATPISFSSLSGMSDLDPDIIHFHSQLSIGAQAIFLAKMMKKPLIATFHGYFMEPEYLKIVKLDKVLLDKNKTIMKFGWNYSNFFLNQADIVISPSEISKLDLMAHGFKKHIEVISNGIDLSLLSVERTKEYPLPKKYFLYTGRVSPEKSLDILIKAFHLFSLKNKEVDLVIVGDGPASDDVRKLTSKLRLGKRVHMLGVIQHSDLIHSNILANALAFVTASKSESQPVSVLEALAFKLPIIGVNEKGVPELIQKNGIICKADDIDELSKALTTVASDNKLRATMSAQSYKFAQDHSLESSTKILEELYSQCIKRKNNRRKNS